MFRVTVEDLDTGESSVMLYEHAETTISTGFRRVDPDDGGPGGPQIVETGAMIATVKCWTGEGIGMTKFEDFVNFTDDTGDEPDVPDDGA